MFRQVHKSIFVVATYMLHLECKKIHPSVNSLQVAITTATAAGDTVGRILLLVQEMWMWDHGRKTHNMAVNLHLSGHGMSLQDCATKRCHYATGIAAEDAHFFLEVAGICILRQRGKARHQ